MNLVTMGVEGYLSKLAIVMSKRGESNGGPDRIRTGDLLFDREAC